MKFLTKKMVLLSVPALLVILFLLHAFLAFVWCPVSEWFTYTECYISRDVTSFLFSIGFVIVVTIIPFSLLTIPLALSVFEAWKRFAVWAVPVLLAITALLVIGGEGNAFFSFGFGPFILLVLYALYFLISLIIIFRAWQKSRK